MRKPLAFIAALLMVLCACTNAFAAGKATVTKETFYVVPYLSRYAGTVYGEITNTGDKPVVIDSGVYELFDVDGEAVASSSIYSVYPKIIEPGDQAYFYITEDVEGSTSSGDIDDYSVTIIGKSTSNEYKYLPVVATFSEGLEYNKSRIYNYKVSVENSTDSVQYNIEMVVALFDADGNLLYVDKDSAYGVGVFPGSKIEFKGEISSSIQNQLNASHTEVDTIVSIAWVDADD
ncbi:MAG: hypothetical protein LBS72_04140 [Oscillospiraceae bacterium]|jgi:hypothetical protein|nr:hypothetical protein [Oscillospiraceae bacterium]